MATPAPTAPSAQDVFTTQTTHRYQASIEDSKIVDGVIQRALEDAIQLTMKELLAIAPDVRKGISERPQPKRAPNEPTTSAHVCTTCSSPAPAPPDGTSDDNYEAAITALHQLDEEEPTPQPQTVLSLHNTMFRIVTNTAHAKRQSASEFTTRRLPSCLRKQRPPERDPSATRNPGRRKR
ncbi:hypothetical protein BDN71DRAFT_1514788 [Pleurotus eryngii]|uniref:Uncharacterized protein n=1 Tax=Pleurotus eryngii TaxID=5323 RepID=A0A9P5ZGE3_PLEER|nr:hypothetical protein BDN71DRAFT_1514788 [Pleurotus eryngii]